MPPAVAAAGIGAAGMVGSSLLSKPKKNQTVTQKTEVPTYQSNALSQIFGQAQDVYNNNPTLTPQLSSQTQQGISQLSTPYNGPGLQGLQDTARGAYLDSNPYVGMSDLSGVTDYITSAAQKGVGDQFTAAGRSGSPAEQTTLAKTITQNLSPFAFSANESALNRGNQSYQAERTNQLNSLLPLLGLQDQQAQNSLQAGGVQDQYNQQAAMDPYKRLQLLSNPIASLLGGTPTSSTVTSPTNANTAASVLGAGLSGAQLGSSIYNAFSSPDLSPIDTSTIPAYRSYY